MDILIAPPKGYRFIDVKALWEFHNLWWLLVRREAALTFRQTLLGPLWLVLQPWLSSLVLWVIFGLAVKLPGGGRADFLFFLSGTLLWGAFAQTLESVASSLKNGAALFDKVYFPRLIVPLSQVGWRVISGFIQLVAFCGWFLWQKGPMAHLGLALLWFPLWMGIIVALALGLGLCVAVFSIRYRDLQQLVRVGLQLGMYATPVFYPLSALSPQWSHFLRYNPLAFALEGFRSALFLGNVSTELAVSSILGALFFLCVGLIAFHRVESYFLDIL